MPPHTTAHPPAYGVATISRLLKITVLFCRVLSLLQGSFAKETYNFKEPTSRSYPIVPNFALLDINIYAYYIDWYTYCDYLVELSHVLEAHRPPKIIGLFCKRDTIIVSWSALDDTIWLNLHHYRVAKTHGMPYRYRLFSAKEPCNLWLFCRKWPAA